MNHYIIQCSCGNVIAQCRCPDSNKTVTISEKKCVMCQLGTGKVKTHREHRKASLAELDSDWS